MKKYLLAHLGTQMTGKSAWYWVASSTTHVTSCVMVHTRAWGLAKKTELSFFKKNKNHAILFLTAKSLTIYLRDIFQQYTAEHLLLTV